MLRLFLVLLLRETRSKASEIDIFGIFFFNEFYKNLKSDRPQTCSI
jgi:hypothetical protein